MGSVRSRRRRRHAAAHTLQQHSRRRGGQQAWCGGRIGGRPPVLLPARGSSREGGRWTSLAQCVGLAAVPQAPLPLFPSIIALALSLDSPHLDLTVTCTGGGVPTRRTLSFPCSPCSRRLPLGAAQAPLQHD